MPFHDPHELSTNATITSARARLAIRLNLRMLIIPLPQPAVPVPRGRVLPGRPAQARTVVTRPGRPVSRPVRDQAAVPAADTTAAATGCSRCRSLADRAGFLPAAPRTPVEPL